MSTRERVVKILDEALSLKGRAGRFSDDTPLLGSLPELDSMAVLSVITAIEDQFGIVIADDELSGDTFATLGSLVRFVESKLAT